MKYKNFPIFLFIVAVVLGALFYWTFSTTNKPPFGQKVAVAPAGTINVPSNTYENPSVSKSKILDLSNQNLEKISTSIFNKTDIEELNVSNNKLTGALPSEIGKLTKLKVLNASNNLMTGVPAEIGHLPNLEILDLSNNKLTGLPNELGELKKLKVLNLSGNDYSNQDLEVIKRGLSSDVKIIQ